MAYEKWTVDGVSHPIQRLRNEPQLRRRAAEPVDQAAIPHPRLGFFGVIDERMDVTLLEGMAAARPDWHLVMLGPVVKIDPAGLPHLPNVHYLGAKSYDQLPAYIAGWDVAWLVVTPEPPTPS